MFDATTQPDSNMLTDGNLTHAAATQKLALFFHDWVAVQILSTSADGQAAEHPSRTIHYLQNWNNALPVCTRKGDCGALPDGYGDIDTE